MNGESLALWTDVNCHKFVAESSWKQSVHNSHHHYRHAEKVRDVTYSSRNIGGGVDAILSAWILGLLRSCMGDGGKVEVDRFRINTDNSSAPLWNTKVLCSRTVSSKALDEEKQDRIEKVFG